MKRDLSKENWGVLNCSNYNGLIIWRSGEGYNWAGNYYPSQKELDEAIEKACQIINKSITVQNNNGTISVTNTG